MNELQFLTLDSRNMRAMLQNFHQQVTEAVQIGKNATLLKKFKKPKNIVVAGLGGSAIGGDLLRTYLADELSIPMQICRHYVLPNYVDKDSLVIISSYSGNTEETIAAHKDAIKRKATVICLSTNGETEKLAKKNGQMFVKLPPGFPPRAALGYSFFPTLVLFARLGLIKSKDGEIKETLQMLKQKGEQYSSLDAKQNPSLALAEKLYGKLPIVYSGADRFDVVGYRWRGQICENSKALSFGHVIPEMNHNELVGWKVLKNQMRDMTVIFLRDSKDHKRVGLRMNIMKEIVGKYASGVEECWSEGKSNLTRMFSLIHLGDWMSFYLAILNNVNPTPVEVIDYLKEELSKVK
ncbi:MAG: bifunctional phosphoglucose/phosphomannose isomerase [Ignavibacteriales bacterium]|nr:bifunctional phosphoglucose/phosphomannose isomerase [Ignavibacteriales bacterium]